MDPFFRSIYPASNKVSDLLIEKFCSACSELSRSPVADCRSVLNNASLAICPKCHKSIEPTLARCNIEEINSSAPLQTQADPNKHDPQPTVLSPTKNWNKQLTRSQKFVRWVKKNPVNARFSGSIAFLGLITAIITSFFSIRGNSETVHIAQATKQVQELDQLVKVEKEDEVQANKDKDNPLRIGEANERIVSYTRMIGMHEGDDEPVEIPPAKILKGHTSLISCSRLSSDGKTFITGSWDKTAIIWDVATWKERAVLKGHTDLISCITLSRDGKTLITGSADKTVRIWDVATGQQRIVLKGHKSHTGLISCIKLSRDDKTLITGSEDNTAIIWDVATGKELALLKGHTNWISCITLSRDGKTLITGSLDNTARIWDVATGQERAVLKGHTDWIMFLTLSSDGKMIITGSKDKTTRIWDVATGKERAVLKGHAEPISCIQLSSDGKTLITGSVDKSAIIWDVVTGKQQAILKGHTGWILCITLSSDGKSLITGSVDKTARIWDLSPLSKGTLNSSPSPKK